jgi:hypothetical protein
MVINDDDAARAVAANKEQFRVSQMTNKSIINREVSFNDQMTHMFRLINFDICWHQIYF